jgi:hypothetical protein
MDYANITLEIQHLVPVGSDLQRSDVLHYVGYVTAY